jgi:hypothetical protein
MSGDEWDTHILAVLGKQFLAEVGTQIIPVVGKYFPMWGHN